MRKGEHCVHPDVVSWEGHATTMSAPAERASLHQTSRSVLAFESGGTVFFRSVNIMKDKESPQNILNEECQLNAVPDPEPDWILNPREKRTLFDQLTKLEYGW